MKRVGVLILSVFLVGFVLAAYGNPGGAAVSTQQGNAPADSSVGSQIRLELEAQINNSNLTEMEKEQLREQVRNVSGDFDAMANGIMQGFGGGSNGSLGAELRGSNGTRIQTMLNVSREINGTMRVRLSNGVNAEVKVMPENASETALERLRLRDCNLSDNCSIELREVGLGNQTRLVYEAKAQKTYKVLGIFSNLENVSVQIDAETGETVSTNRPWWSWLASGD